MKTLRDKHYIVTGANGGIGNILVTDLLSRNARVTATDINTENLEKLQGRLNTDNLNIRKLDVTSEKSWADVFADFEKSVLDGLINAAGILKPGYIHSVSADDIQAHMNINATGLMIGSSIAAARMKKQKSGHIINIASLAGVSPVPGIALYSASKFALRGFTLALAEEMRDFNVDVSVICPDAVKTPMLDLQADYEEAALTFSSGKALSAIEISEVIINCLENPQLEILIPGWRGALAKMNNALPDIARHIMQPLKEMGMKTQKNYRN